MRTLFHIYSPDFSAMLTELMDEYHMPESELCDRLRIVDLSGALLRHYRRGGVPNYPRGAALISLWCEVTGKPEFDAPVLEWSPPYRVDESSPPGPKCTTCGQVMRGQRRQRWTQLQLHHETHMEHSAMPSWLEPKVKVEAV